MSRPAHSPHRPLKQIFVLAFWHNEWHTYGIRNTSTYLYKSYKRVTGYRYRGSIASPSTQVLHTGNLLLLLLEQKNHTKGYLFENNSCNKELFGISCLFWTIETWLAERYIVAIGYIAGWSLYVTERIIEQLLVVYLLLQSTYRYSDMKGTPTSYSLECCNSSLYLEWEYR